MFPYTIYTLQDSCNDVQKIFYSCGGKHDESIQGVDARRFDHMASHVAALGRYARS